MILASFLLGFFGSLHCLGMCGPIVFALPIKKNNLLGVLQNIIYQFGRVFSYTFLGVVFGLMGKGLKLSGLQQNLSIILGCIMILSVFVPQKKIKKYTSKTVGLFLNKLKKIFGELFKNNSIVSFFIIGILNGFLPCGLVYVAIFNSIESADIIQGGWIMIAFGIGTIPIMFFATWFIKLIGVQLRNKILKFLPIFIVIIGLLFIVRGMGLKIPYLSPPEKSLEVNKNKKCCGSNTN